MLSEPDLPQVADNGAGFRPAVRQDALPAHGLVAEKPLPQRRPFESETEDWNLYQASYIHPRQISDEEARRFEGYVAEILTALGLNLDTPATAETPRRFLSALFDSTEGYDGDPKLLKVFDTECRGDPDCRMSQLIEGPIPFFALCEHHALPFYGRAYVGYISHEHIIGLSKLTRLVRLFAKRFTVQERLGQQIADTLEEMLHPHGTAVYLEAHHLCMEMRGVRSPVPLTRTTTWRAAYVGDADLRREFLQACGPIGDLSAGGA